MTGPRLVGAHELGSYAYCERSWWYDHHPPRGREGGPRTGDTSFARGTAFHAEVLSAHVRAQHASRAGYAAAALAGLLLLFFVLWGYRLFHFSWPLPW